MIPKYPIWAQDSIINNQKEIHSNFHLAKLKNLAFLLQNNMIIGFILIHKTISKIRKIGPKALHLDQMFADFQLQL
jgi:hypothetical protein